MYKILILILTLSLNFSSLAAKNNDEVKNYVNDLVNEVSTMLGDPKLSDDDKISKSRKLISENLDLEWMAKYTLGRHKKNLSPAQIKEFITVYSNYVIKSYSDLVKNYKGQKAKIKNVQNLDKDEYIVKMEIIGSGGQPPIKVEYLVRFPNDQLKTANITTEGVSMIDSQKSEFNSIISNGSFDSLISELKKKL